MNSAYIQNLQDKLQRRVKSLTRIEKDFLLYYTSYSLSLKRFYHFLNNTPVFKDIIKQLTANRQDMELKANQIINYATEERSSSPDIEILLELIDEKEEQKYAALSYFIIKGCSLIIDKPHLEALIGYFYGKHDGEYNDVTRSYTTNNGMNIHYFNLLFLKPFCDYLEEQLDEQRITLALLNRYKHKCEWFQREHLYYKKRIREKKLAMNLYEYLYDQGLEFFIEPWSASGEIDLIEAQKESKDRLIADVKIFNGDKHYLAKGFHQIYQYTKDYNEPFGYLVIFKTCEEDLKFNLPNQTQSTNYLTYNNKTIFFITIDIFPHKKSASQKGKVKTHEIDENYLIGIIKEETKKKEET